MSDIFHIWSLKIHYCDINYNAKDIEHAIMKGVTLFHILSLTIQEQKQIFVTYLVLSLLIIKQHM